MIYYEGECRYCRRYNRACGRDHNNETEGDWTRDWKGQPRPRVSADQIAAAQAQAQITKENYHA